MKNKLGHTKTTLRRNNILEIIQREKKVYIAELSKRFSVSLVTIRSDLDILAEEGKLVRMAGGAILLAAGDMASEKKIINYEAKREIAIRTARLIQDGDVLFINSGTTTELVAHELKSHKNLNIVTNSLAVAMKLGNVPSFRVILLGGAINSQYGFTYGADVQEHLSHFSADWAILSIDGVSSENEISTCHDEEVIIDRIMIARAKKVLIVADSSKIGRTGFSYVDRCSDKIKVLTNNK